MASPADLRYGRSRRAVREGVSRSVAAARRAVPEQGPGIHPLLCGVGPHRNSRGADPDARWPPRTRCAEAGPRGAARLHPVDRAGALSLAGRTKEASPRLNFLLAINDVRSPTARAATLRAAQAPGEAVGWNVIDPRNDCGDVDLHLVLVLAMARGPSPLRRRC
jgi:hypothetical protein